VHLHFAGVLPQPVTSVPTANRAPSDLARLSSSRSVSYCGVISTNGKRLGSRDRSTLTLPSRPSRSSRCPVRISSSASPRASSSSSVLACTANARDRLDSPSPPLQHGNRYPSLGQIPSQEQAGGAGPDDQYLSTVGGH
jgi:hypothetical protein